MFRPHGLIATALDALAKAGLHVPQPVSRDHSSGAQNYRGRGGNRAYQRAAMKKRNQARHRRACR